LGGQDGRQAGRRHLSDDGARIQRHAGGLASYLAVDDVDTCLRTATAAGAKTMREPFDVPGVGRIAILQEPGGAMIYWITPVAS